MGLCFIGHKYHDAGVLTNILKQNIAALPQLVAEVWMPEFQRRGLLEETFKWVLYEVDLRCTTQVRSKPTSLMR